MNGADQKTILLVEDIALIAKSESYSIRQWGYTVITANTGEEAVRLAATPISIDLILMDIDLGQGIDGPQAARQILNKRNIPIVFLTAHFEKEYVDKVKEITRYGFIIKNSGDFVLRSSIEMAFELFEANEELKNSNDEFESANQEHIATIRELIRIQEALRESEEKYRLLIENSHDILYTLSIEGVFIFVSPAWTTLLGHPLDMVTGHPFQPFVHPDDLPMCMMSLQKVLETGQRLEGVEYRVQHIDGSWRWHTMSAVPLKDKTGKVIGFEGTARDISERKLAGQLFQDIIDKNPLSIQIVDKDGFTLQGNPAYTELFGVNPPPDFSIFTDLEQKSPELERLVLLAKSGEVVHFPDVYYNPHDISADYPDIPLWIRALIFPLNDSSEKPERFVLMHENITERIQAQSQREKLQLQLNQAQKMESVGRLAGGVAHDFNNMLGVILGYAELALDRLDPTQPLYADLQEIRKAAERSADLTRQLLSFARKQTIAPKVLDLNNTIEGMLNMLRRLIGEDIDLIWLPGKQLEPVKMDPSQIDQILANLCVNARDAMKDGGRISIATKNIHLDGHDGTAYPESIPGDYVCLTFTDSGCGMAPETLVHLFEPFFTTKALGQGTGLGLATVYGIVKQNNGFIYVNSQLEKGTCFTLFLPSYVDQTTAPDLEKHR